MKITTFETTEDWLEGRRTNIMGSKLKDIVVKRGTGKKVGFYQLIADHLAIEDDEDPRDRGHRLEEEAISELSTMTGIKFNTSLVIISRDDNPHIAYSPDGYTDDGKVSVEVKCLKSALHIQAIIENKIPSEYFEQSLQPFVVNDQLELLYFVFYDPRIVSHPIHVIEILREDYEDYITKSRDYQENVLKEVNQWVEKLSW